MRKRWPMVACCLLAIGALRAEGRYGFDGGRGWRDPNLNGAHGNNGQNPGNTPANNPHNPASQDTAMGEAAWTGGGNGAGDTNIDSVYKPLTKDQADKAVSDLRDAAKAMDDKFRLHLSNSSSAHTLVYATGAASVADTLSAKAEQAYSVAARVFASQPKEIILPGKILVYVFDKSSAYESFAKNADNFTVPQGVLGYTWLADDGSGALHVVMGPPPTEMADRSVKPITAWQAALTRAMIFAVVDRYHSSRPVPTWVMQGLADATADSILPQPANRARAYLFSQQKDASVPDVLNDKNADFAVHPVMQTLTELLVGRDRLGYSKFVLALKAGKPASDALQSAYKLSFDQFTTAWTAYVNHFAVSGK